jgi:hypothetical protein
MLAILGRDACWQSWGGMRATLVIALAAAGHHSAEPATCSTGCALRAGFLRKLGTLEDIPCPA